MDEALDPLLELDEEEVDDLVGRPRALNSNQTIQFNSIQFEFTNLVGRPRALRRAVFLEEHLGEESNG